MAKGHDYKMGGLGLRISGRGTSPIDPRTGCYVGKLFTFYPVPQMSPTGWVFLSEHEGLPLKLPANMDWWTCIQRNTKGKMTKQKVGILRQGGYTPVEFDLEVSRALRVSDKTKSVITQAQKPAIAATGELGSVDN